MRKRLDCSDSSPTRWLSAVRRGLAMTVAMAAVPAGAWAQSGGDSGMGLTVAIAGGAVLLLAGGVAFVFWNRSKANEPAVAPPPIEIKPIVPKVARPRPSTPKAAGSVAEPSDENLLQFGAVGKMNVPSKRPVPQVPATAPPLPPEPEVSKAPTPAPKAAEPPKLPSSGEGPPRIPSSSAPSPVNMPSVPAGLTAAVAKPMSLVPEIAAPVAAAVVAPIPEAAVKSISLAAAGASNIEEFLNEPARPNEVSGSPVASLSIDLSSFEPPKAAPPAAVEHHSTDVPSLSLDLSAAAPAPVIAAPRVPQAPLAFADLPALKLEDFFELQPVADLIHNEETAPDLAAHGGPVIVLGDDPLPAPSGSMHMADAVAFDAGAFEGVPSISLDLPELGAGLDALQTP